MNTLFEQKFDSINKPLEKNRIESFIFEIDKKLDSYLKSIVQTNLFICEHFDSIVSEIDYETECVLVNLDKIYYESNGAQQIHNESDANGDEDEEAKKKLLRIDLSSETFELNKIRNSMIKMLRDHERSCFSDEKLNEAMQRQRHKKHDSMRSNLDKLIKSDPNNQLTFKRLFYLNRKLDQELHEICKEIFQNRSIFYIPNRNKFDTKLLTIREEIEVECLKNNDASYFLKQKVQKSYPKSIGYLISIEDLYLTAEEFDIAKY